MFHSISLGISSLSDQRVMLVLLKVVALTLVVFALSGVGLWFGIDGLFDHYGLRDDGGLSALLALTIMGIAGWVLFRAVAVAITWIFADDIIDAVEDKHYAFASVTGKRPNMRMAARMALRSLARVVGYNLLLLPVYLLLLFTGVGTALAFLIVNGYLLGRDLEDMLVARHGEDQRLGAIRRFVLGLGSTAAMLVPLLGLIVPVVATAAAVHMAHDRTGKI